jgi:hypothetical protein
MPEMAVKYRKELERPPNCLPGGWAAFLYLYDLRWRRISNTTATEK